jgi:hypothetical protein
VPHHHVSASFFIAIAVCLAAAAALGRVLPTQNVAFIFGLLGAVEAAYEFSRGGENLLAGAIFWPGAIIFSRMAAQMLLKPWRRNRNYGWLLLGLASCLPAVVSLILDSPMQAAVRFCMTAACLFALAPWFIQKRVIASEAAKE